MRLMDKYKLIDHGFFRLSAKEAKRLCNGKLPRIGYEKRIEEEGVRYWIARTIHNGKCVWSIREADPEPFGPFPLKIGYTA